MVTCVPNFPTGKVFNGYSNKFLTREWMDGIQVIRVWSYISANEGFIKRIMDYVSFSIMAVLFSLRLKFDIIIATSPQFFTALAGLFLSKMKNKPWIMEIRDLWPESILAVGAMKNNNIIRLLEWLEIRCYYNADLLISVTDSIKQVIVNKGISSKKIDVVKNGANLELFTPQQKAPYFTKENNLVDKFVVGYIGTLGIAHGLDFIIRSAKIIKDQSVHILLMGEGAKKHELQNMVTDEKIHNVTILDAVKKDEVINVISSIDVSLINLKKSQLFTTVIPSKIFENAAMIKPILLGVKGEAKQIIEQYQAGLCFEPENTNDFVEKLLLLKNDSSLYKKCQKGCQNLAYEFDRKKLAVEMLNIIHQKFSFAQ